MSTQESSSGYGWDDLEYALIAMVPGIENTHHGAKLFLRLREDRGAMIRDLKETFGDDIDAVLESAEVIVEAEKEVRKHTRLIVRNEIPGIPDKPQRMDRGLRSAFLTEPKEEDEMDADIEDGDNYDERALRLAGADLAPEASVADDAEYSDALARESEGQD